jgi:3-oxocholest-4-en-26-oyl-CoA dehydrogenase beta subunit
MVGGAQQILDMTVAYAKKREQFGKPIGSFQTTQHHCVNVLMDLDARRWVTYKTAWMINEGMPFDKQVSIAKALCNEANRRIFCFGAPSDWGCGILRGA